MTAVDYPDYILPHHHCDGSNSQYIGIIVLKLKIVTEDVNTLSKGSFLANSSTFVQVSWNRTLVWKLESQVDLTLLDYVTTLFEMARCTCCTIGGSLQCCALY